MQQVLLMTLERLRAGRLRQPEKLASFVLGMCRMVVLELRRGTARREGLLRMYGDTPEAIEPPEPRDLDEAKLAGCLEWLPERERSVLVMVFFATSRRTRWRASLACQRAMRASSVTAPW